MHKKLSNCGPCLMGYPQYLQRDIQKTYPPDCSLRLEIWPCWNFLILPRIVYIIPRFTPPWRSGWPTTSCHDGGPSQKVKRYLKLNFNTLPLADKRQTAMISIYRSHFAVSAFGYFRVRMKSRCVSYYTYTFHAHLQQLKIDSQIHRPVYGSWGKSLRQIK